ncbi:MAG: ABC transporter permease [Verrucomicrobiales bacterium]|nr:ABC transporter permease [Verrucomicrobiota bacterium JB025]
MKEITIEAGRGEKQYWQDIWGYRELFYFLAWRNILVRYKQTVIGVAWAVLRPLLTVLVLTFVFQRVAGMKSEGAVPYSIMVFCGMLPWQFFATAFMESGNSLVSNAGMISKVYFPRLAVPVSSVITSFIDFLVSGVLLALLMAVFGVVPSPMIVALPLFILLAFATALGAGLWVSALMVRYRDFRFIVPFVVQFGLYLSPVGFSAIAVPEKYRLLYSLNPMVGVIDGFRWAILGQKALYWPGLGLAFAGVAVLLVTGVWYFRKTERTFADVI